jgi:xanthine dehydrogenase small subunit
MGASPEDNDGLAAALSGIQADEDLAMEHKGHRFFAPRSADALAAVFEANPDATMLAGGTDVGLWVTKLHRDLPTIISLNEAADLREIDDLGDAIRIAAAVRYTDAYPVLEALHPAFGELLRRLGGLQVRNLGTVCGNIANGSPIGDMPPALIAAGATLVLRKGAARRELPLEDFFLAYGKQDRRPGEFVEAVIVPKVRWGVSSASPSSPSASTRTSPRSAPGFPSASRPAASPMLGSPSVGWRRSRSALPPAKPH